jgi:sulfite reductase alpha subunit-like flavoprotein
VIEGADGHLPAVGASPAVDMVDETTLRLAARSERLLSRAPSASQPELEELLTESCTRSYILEAQRVRTRRQMLRALAGASPSLAARAAREKLQELVGRYYSITEELDRVEVLIARLRARLETMQPT